MAPENEPFARPKWQEIIFQLIFRGERAVSFKEGIHSILKAWARNTLKKTHFCIRLKRLWKKTFPPFQLFSKIYGIRIFPADFK